MPERIPELDDFVNQTAFVRGLPADEIRRRGDRRRTTRRVTGGVVAAALLTAAGIGVWQSPLMDGPRQPNWATTPSATPTVDPSPSVSPTPSEDPTPSPSPTASPTVVETVTVQPPSPPTWDNVPDAAIMFPYGQALGKDPYEYEGMGQSAKGFCDPGEWGNPTTTLVREFGLTDDTTYAFAMVLGYANDTEAEKGFETIRKAAVECARALKTPYVADADTDPALPANDADQSIYVLSLHPADNPDEGWWNATNLVRDGERVLWRVETAKGQDYNCSVLPNEDAGQCGDVKTTDAAIKRLRGE